MRLIQRQSISALFMGALLLTVPISGSLGHGYISSPSSRSLMCANSQNTNCGPIRWEPQSVEGPDRFPTTGPADGKLASAGLSQFSQLNEQSFSRWAKSSISGGSIDISWHFTANHVTRDFRYFLTKQGWNPNSPLTRDTFELTPFCEVDGNMQRPPVDVTHACVLPADRTGYHVLLGVWDVGDTVNSFYQAVDIVIDGSNPSPWIDVGDIYPSMDLLPNDQVTVRVFDDSGELPHLNVSWTVDSVENGGAQVWPKRVAEAVNATSSVLKVGILDNDEIIPALGKNDIFVDNSSSITRVEIEIVQVGSPNLFDLSELQNSYPIENESANVTFTLNAFENVFITLNITNDLGDTILKQQFSLEGEQALDLLLSDVIAGTYSLAISAINQSGETENISEYFHLFEPGNGEYEYVYPESITQYQAGTRVLAKNGGVYECKPFPYEGWCRIYSESANHYEPGVGSHWQDAWILIEN